MLATLDVMRSAVGSRGPQADHGVDQLERALRMVAKAVVDDIPHCHRRKRPRTSIEPTDSMAPTDLSAHGMNVHIVCVGGGSHDGGDLGSGNGTSIPARSGIKVTILKF